MIHWTTWDVFVYMDNDEMYVQYTESRQAIHPLQTACIRHMSDVYPDVVS